MIVQEEVPYTKEEVKAMVKTIHDLREKVSQLGWHPASEAPLIKENGKSEWLVSYVECDNNRAAFLRDTVNVYYDSETKTWLDAWGDVQCVEWWSIPPKKEGEL